MEAQVTQARKAKYKRQIPPMTASLHVLHAEGCALFWFDFTPHGGAENWSVDEQADDIGERVARFARLAPIYKRGGIVRALGSNVAGTIHTHVAGAWGGAWKALEEAVGECFGAVARSRLLPMKRADVGRILGYLCYKNALLLDLPRRDGKRQRQLVTVRGAVSRT